MPTLLQGSSFSPPISAEFLTCLDFYFWQMCEIMKNLPNVVVLSRSIYALPPIFVSVRCTHLSQQKYLVVIQQ